MRLKYIVTDTGDFAVFSEAQTHVEVSRGLSGNPIGAGYCTLARLADTDSANIHCFGESVTLDLKSRPEDEQIINSYINRDL